VPYWHVANAAQITCVPIDGGVTPDALAAPGWLLVREGLVIVEGQASDLAVSVTVPDGTYDVAAGVRPLGWLWRLPGMFDRAHEALRSDLADVFVPLGEHQAVARRLEVRLPAATGQGQRIVNLRLTPRGAGEKYAPTVDREHEERLRTLGYVE
jgi:hypothetical protein